MHVFRAQNRADVQLSHNTRACYIYGNCAEIPALRSCNQICVSPNGWPSDTNSWVGLLRLCARKKNHRVDVFCGFPWTLQPKPEIVPA